MSLNSGGRGLEAFLRPYPRFTAGTPLHFSFDYQKGTMRYEYIGDEREGDTDFFIPSYQYPHGFIVDLSDGSYEYLYEEQSLIHHPMRACKKHTIIIKRK